MTARAFIAPALVVACLVVLLPPGEAHASRVVVVKAQDITPYNLAVEGFRRSFQGETTVMEMTEDEITSGELREIRERRPAALVAIGSRAASSLKAQIDDIPIIYCMVMNARQRGLTGPNISGISLEIPPSEQLAQFRRVVPDLRKVGIIHNPGRGSSLTTAARQAARETGVTLVEREASGPGEVPGVIDELVGEVDGLWLLPDASLVTNETFRHILVTSLERRLPLFVFSLPFVRAGALVGVAPNYTRIGEEAAAIAGEVISGTQAGSIPVRDPPTAVVVNGATADRIGLELSEEVRAGASILQ